MMATHETRILKMMEVSRRSCEKKICNLSGPGLFWTLRSARTRSSQSTEHRRRWIHQLPGRQLQAMNPDTDWSFVIMSTSAVPDPATHQEFESEFERNRAHLRSSMSTWKRMSGGSCVLITRRSNDVQDFKPGFLYWMRTGVGPFLKGPGIGNSPKASSESAVIFPCAWPQWIHIYKNA